MTTLQLNQPRVSPNETVKDMPSPSSQSTEVSWTLPPMPKKSRFRMRRRSSNTVPTSCMSMDDSSSSLFSHCSMNKKKKKKRSLLYRLLGKSSSKKSLVIDTSTPCPLIQDTEVLDPAEEPMEYEEEDTTEIDRLEEQGQELRLAGQVQDALDAWNEALTLASALSYSSTLKSNQIRCRMISLHLQMDEHDKAEALVEQLQPLSCKDTSVSFVPATEELLELFIRHDCWTYALELSHQMPEAVPPLTLARLHLEVALQQSDIRHLSECHQLLLEVDNPCADALWQELAQAYSMEGQDELALGCSGARMNHVHSPLQMALAHYDQAFGYGEAAQYGLALKECQLALTALDNGSSDVVVEEDDDEEELSLLLTKLYQFKADVLCRMGRISDSITAYQQLLKAYLDSSTYGPVDAANVLYILGKLSVRCKKFRDALDYFDQELQMTQSVVGNCHLASSKILHELARVADAGLMDYPLAVQYLERALRVESGVFQSAKQQEELALLNDAKAQMGETKQSLGKLHFKMGDFATAVKTTLAVDK